MKILLTIAGILALMLFTPLYYIYGASAGNSSLIFLNRILSGNELNYEKNLQRISGGRSLLVDDPANYAIYEELEKHIRAFRKDIENQSDMISYYKYQDALLGNLIDILQRIRELCLQESNTILSDSDRGIINGKIDQDYRQIIFDLKESQFNTKRIFEGFFENDAVMKALESRDHYSLDRVDSLIDDFIKERASIGARMKGLEYMVSGERQAGENLENMQSGSDTDIARESSSLTLNHLKMIINLLMLKETSK